MSITYREQALSSQVDTLEASIGRILQPMEFWSDLQATVVVNDTAADKTLPNVTVAEVPTGATIVRAIMIFKYKKVVESSTSDNATVAAQTMSISLVAGRTDVLTAINIGDNSFSTTGSATEGGDAIVGDNDIAAKVTANATYYPTWELADCDAVALTFYDVQVGFRIWYSI